MCIYMGREKGVCLHIHIYMWKKKKCVHVHIWKKRKRDRERMRNRYTERQRVEGDRVRLKKCSTPGFFPQRSTVTSAGPGLHSSQELNLGFPNGCQEANCCLPESLK